MDSSYDLVEIQSWIHLFQNKSSVLHEEEVHEFYYNIEFAEDGSIKSRVGDKILHLDEDQLGQILEVPREGIRSLVRNSCTTEFTEKWTAASAVDLFIMESLCKFEPIDLPALMMEHMYRSVIEHKGKHGMGYGYFLTKVVHHLNIPVGTGEISTAKKSFTLTTLVECECIEGKTGPLSKISQLVMEQNQLKHELDEMTVRLLKAQTERPGTAEINELRKKNNMLLAQKAALQEKIIKNNDVANARLTLGRMKMNSLGILKYAKYVKDIVASKRRLTKYETVALIEECSSRIQTDCPKS
ncbi:hypothetical protein KY290_005261 [Solanum tuberosum]|uniref:Uncharacterized protein n=1 Tax=Solanum tuberosum TaxID=4113 RepID=A0ABQ7WDL9_SOLTU|nr:hypothetical protein KY289_005656 [Solanum tuberosum]KAH0778834.1 hypothetical protein KY290_005261 [Solanum tuberosum]